MPPSPDSSRSEFQVGRRRGGKQWKRSGQVEDCRDGSMGGGFTTGTNIPRWAGNVGPGPFKVVVRYHPIPDNSGHIESTKTFRRVLPPKTGGLFARVCACVGETRLGIGKKEARRFSRSPNGRSSGSFARRMAQKIKRLWCTWACSLDGNTWKRSSFTAHRSHNQCIRSQSLVRKGPSSLPTFVRCPWGGGRVFGHPSDRRPRSNAQVRAAINLLDNKPCHCPSASNPFHMHRAHMNQH